MANANAHFDPKVLGFLHDTSNVTPHRDSGNARALEKSDATPVLLLGDNKPSVTVHHNLEDAKRGKALDIRSHYLRHLIASRQVDYRHIPGSENPADVMTKQEHFPAFQRMRSRMNIR